MKQYKKLSNVKIMLVTFFALLTLPIIAQRQGTTKDGITPYLSPNAEDIQLVNVYFVNKNEAEMVVRWKLVAFSSKTKFDASVDKETVVKGNSTSSTVKVLTVDEDMTYWNVDLEIISVTKSTAKADAGLSKQEQIKPLVEQAQKAYINKFYDLAKENLQKILTLDPTYWQAHNLLGNVYYANENYASAILSYTKAISNNPDEAFLYRNLGNTYMKTKNYSESINCYQKAIVTSKSESENLICFENMSIAYLYLGDLEQAVSNAKKVANESVETYQKKASDAFKSGNNITALKNTLLSLGKLTNASSYGSLSWYLLFEMQYSTAEKAARKALELDNKILWVKTNLAHALLFQNMFTEAERIYRELSQTIYQNNKTYSQTLLDDFKELEKAITISAAQTANVEMIRKMCQEKVREEAEKARLEKEAQERKAQEEKRIAEEKRKIDEDHRYRYGISKDLSDEIKKIYGMEIYIRDGISWETRNKCAVGWRLATDKEIERIKDKLTKNYDFHGYSRPFYLFTSDSYIAKSYLSRYGIYSEEGTNFSWWIEIGNVWKKDDQSYKKEKLSISQGYDKKPSKKKGETDCKNKSSSIYSAIYIKIQ